jgi:ABC-type nickel/cobalt efflux system permease component RcnA
MRSAVVRGALIAGAGVGLVLAVLWFSGAGAAVEAWAQGAARAAQDALARALRALRAGEPGALAAFLSVCLAYGVAHAVGPGHGKALIGGYGLARRVRVLPLAAVALAAALAQATVAAGLVLGGAALFALTRAELGRIADVALPPFGHAAVAVLGLWLAVRGLRGLRAAGGGGQVRGHDHDREHPHDHAHGPGCAHRHAPTAAEVAALTGWRDTALLILGIALRPCTGAVFVMVLCWQFGMVAAGVAGVYAIGLGTAAVTVATAVLAVWAREGALAGLPRLGGLRGALPAIETAAGLVIAATALWLLAGSV